MNIHLTRDQKIKILNSEKLYAIMQQILLREEIIDQDREHFWVIGLANNNRLMFVELISLGTVNKTLVEPMEVFSLALQKRAVKIILCHNHPSGELKPSEADRDVTDRLIQTGLIVNCPVVDHLIITDISYLSFAEIGLLGELEKSLKYVPAYVQVQHAQEQAAAEAEKRTTAKIVTNLKKQGMKPEAIAEITGLTIEEITQLGQ